MRSDGITPRTYENNFRNHGPDAGWPSEHLPKHAPACWRPPWSLARSLIATGVFPSEAITSLIVWTEVVVRSLRMRVLPHSMAVFPSWGFLGADTGENRKANPISSLTGVVVRIRALCPGRMKLSNEAVNLTVLRKLADPGVEGCLYRAGHHPKLCLNRVTIPRNRFSKTDIDSQAVQMDSGVSLRILLKTCLDFQTGCRAVCHYGQVL